MKNRIVLTIFSITAFFFLIPSLSGQALESASPEEVGMSSERLEILSTNLQQYVDNGDLAGSSLLVARRGKVAYFKTFGMQDIENKVKMDDNSIFRIASQSKAIISVGIMILQEEGKLLISHPLHRYIPEFENTMVAIPEDEGYSLEPAKRAVTIRDLLMHTSGVSYGYGIAENRWEEAGIQGWYFANREEPILETVKKMGSLPFESHPGEKWVYGYNTDILGAVIEVASGIPLDQFLKEKILTPLGMNDTHFYLPKEKSNRLSIVYSSSENGLVEAPDPGEMVGQGAYLNGPRTSFSGGAGYLSTSMDYAVFLQMLLNGGEYDGKRILSRKSVELMTVNHLDEMEFPWANGVGFGLGFSVIEDLGAFGAPGTEGAFGWGGAYHSAYWVDPEEELVVVYFTQLIPADNVDDHDKVRALIYQSLVD